MVGGMRRASNSNFKPSPSDRPSAWSGWIASALTPSAPVLAVGGATRNRRRTGDGPLAPVVDTRASRAAGRCCNVAAKPRSGSGIQGYRQTFVPSPVTWAQVAIAHRSRNDGHPQSAIKRCKGARPRFGTLLEIIMDVGCTAARRRHRSAECG